MGTQHTFWNLYPYKPFGILIMKPLNTLQFTVIQLQQNPLQTFTTMGEPAVWEHGKSLH